MDARALMKYFDPIIKWLGEQNVNETIGWPEFNWVPPIPEGYPASIGKDVIHRSVEPKRYLVTLCNLLQSEFNFVLS